MERLTNKERFLLNLKKDLLNLKRRGISLSLSMLFMLGFSSSSDKDSFKDSLKPKGVTSKIYQSQTLSSKNSVKMVSVDDEEILSDTLDLAPTGEEEVLHFEVPRKVLPFKNIYIEPNFEELSVEEKIDYLLTKYDISYEYLAQVATLNGGLQTLEEIDLVDNTLNSNKLANLYQQTLDIFSVEEKFNYVLQILNLNSNELDTILAVCCAEGGGGAQSYLEDYAVAVCILNRLISKSTISYVSNFYGRDLAYNLYYHVICPNQFSVVNSGAYKKYLGRTDLIGYQAALDAFFYRHLTHKYLQFRSWNSNVSNYECYSTGGNKYLVGSTIRDDDLFEDSPVLRKN